MRRRKAAEGEVDLASYEEPAREHGATFSGVGCSSPRVVPMDADLDRAVSALFARVAAEQGRLDLLVNNAWGGHDEMIGLDGAAETPF